MAGLLQVVTYVNNSDKALVYWFERGSTVKLALRCVGIDKRTAAIFKKKTIKLLDKQPRSNSNRAHDHGHDVDLSGRCI